MNSTWWRIQPWTRTGVTVAVVAALIIGSSSPGAAATNPERPYGRDQWDHVVWRDYCDLRGRPPSATELAADVERITAPPYSDDLALARRSLRAYEYLSNAGSHYLGGVVRLYYAYFNREPDSGGLNFWLAKRRAGDVTGLSEVATAFAQSSEFRRTFGSASNSAFVRLVYRNVMGREPDERGAAYWKRRLEGGLTKSSMMLHFSESDEYGVKTYYRTITHVAYEQMAGRAATAADFLPVVIPPGGGTPEFAWFYTLYVRIIDSPEYATLSSQRPYNYCRR